MTQSTPELITTLLGLSVYTFTGSRRRFKTKWGNLCSPDGAKKSQWVTCLTLWLTHEKYRFEVSKQSSKFSLHDYQRFKVTEFFSGKVVYFSNLKTQEIKI
jgi:hypothetical protein